MRSHPHPHRRAGLCERSHSAGGAGNSFARHHRLRAARDQPRRRLLSLPGAVFDLGSDRGAEAPERPTGVGPLRMAYMDVRPADPNGHTVLLLHGKNFNGDYWGRTAADLASAGYRVVIPDQIGFGKSTKPIGYPFSFHQFAANTAALLDHLGLERAAVLGHSMGGMVATRFALMVPDRTERLVLVNPIGLEDWKRVVPYLSVWDWYEQELQKDYASIRTYQLESYYDGAWRPAYERPVELLAGMTLSPDWPRMAWVQALTYDMIFTQPVVYEFGDVAVPTLLIIGTRDRTALGKGLVSEEVRQRLGRYDELGERTAAAIPEAELVELDGVGHLPHLEVYGRFIEPLLRFLEGPSTPSAR
ncbi:MAG TPA: alpha/beta hydrolase [Allosphingosinicella sp.]|nr:alpha/beta hydrolase [Allosphingosinicella sp.]